MKILILVQSLEKGGRTVRISDTAQTFITLGHSVGVFCFSPADEKISGSFPNLAFLECKAKRMGFDISLLFSVLRFIRKHQIDIIHCHCETSYLYGGLAGRILNIPVIGTYHRSNLAFYEPGWKFKFLNRLLARSVAISNSRKKLIVDQLDCREDYVEIIHGGIDVDKFIFEKNNREENARLLGIHPTPGPLLLSMGHLGSIKGHDILIQAFAEVLSNRPGLYLYIAGDGSESERLRLEELIESLQLKDNVTLLGQVKNPAQWMSVADAFVMAPREEGFGLVFAEASIMGLPIVATRVGGIPDIIVDGETGLLVAPESVDELACALERILKDESFATSLGQAAALRAIKKFNRKFMGESYAHLMENLLEEKNAKKLVDKSIHNNKPIRIAHFVSSLQIGGAERFAMDLSMEQQRSGMEPIIINMGHFTDLFVEVAKADGTKVYSPKTFSRLKTYLRIKNILKTNDIDICHIHSPAVIKYLSLFIPFLKQKVIYTRHGERTLSSLQWRLIHRVLVYSIDKVTFVSRGGREIFLKYQGWPADKCLVIENGVYIPAEENPYEKKMVLRLGSVGRMVPLKKQIHLLEAFIELSKNQKERLELHFFGDGSELIFLKQFVLSHGMEDRAFFHGSVLRREQIYKDFDVLVVNSETEGLSLAIMEAMARAKAVIASDVGGNSQLVEHGVNGFIYPYGDIDKLKAHILWMLDNPEKIIDMGEKSREKMRLDFSMEETSRRYQDLYLAYK